MTFRSDFRSELTIDIQEVGSGKYSAHLGDELLCVAKEPLFAAALVLIIRGIDPDTRLLMRRKGAVRIDMTARLGYAAGVRVTEDNGRPMIRRWNATPFPAAARYGG
jgi:hypothetical protein